MVDRETIQKLIPHRPPFLFIDSILAYHRAEKPQLACEIHSRYSKQDFLISKSLKYWPGVYLIEGLGQCCMLLSIIFQMHKTLDQDNFETGSILQRIIDLGLNSHIVEQNTINNGLLAFVDVNNKREVEVGSFITYNVQLIYQQGDLSKFNVEASESGQTIMSGSIIGGASRKFNDET